MFRDKFERSIRHFGGNSEGGVAIQPVKRGHNDSILPKLSELLDGGDVNSRFLF
jgi:hypothetical protein